MKNFEKFEDMIDESYELFENALFKEALELLQKIEEEFPQEPETAYQKALILEREKKTELEAQRLFKLAFKKDPSTFPLALKISNEEIKDIAQKTLNDYEIKFKKELKGLSLFIEDFPSDDEIFDSEELISPDILGLFKGRRAFEENDLASSGNVFPAQIILYKKNLARECQTYEELKKEIKITILHELAHYFGLEEDEVEKLGL